MQDSKDISEKAAESVIHRLWATHGTNALLGVAIFLLTMYWNDYRDERKTEAVSRQETIQTINQIQSDVRNINTRLDEGVVKQVAQHQEALRRIEDRLSVLERRAKLP